MKIAAGQYFDAGQRLLLGETVADLREHGMNYAAHSMRERP